MKDNVKIPEGRPSIDASQLQWLLELRRHVLQCRAKWKTTLFQAESLFLTVFLPLSLGSKPTEPARFGILLSALLASVSLIAGLLSMILESDRLNEMAIRELNRIREGGAGVVLDEPMSWKSIAATSTFVSFAVTSLATLYAFASFPDFVLRNISWLYFLFQSMR